MENIIVVTFDIPSKAYQALSIVKELDDSGQLSLRSAVVVERQADGQPVVRDGVDAVAPFGTAWGGMVGALIGLLGSPAGVVVGWSAGTIAGATGDTVASARSDSLVATIGERIPAGTTALIAAVDEYAVKVADGAMGQLGGVVAREATADVKAEIQAEKDARRAAEQEAERKEHEEHQLERERARAEQHNDRIDRVQHWLEGQKEPVPPQPAEPTAAAPRG